MIEIVRSSLFEQYPDILFGMSTAGGGVSAGTLGLNLSFHVKDDPENVRRNRSLFFQTLGIHEENVAFTRQEHTSLIRDVMIPGPNETCDALVTRTTGLFLAISIADCTPVMLFDPVTGVVAGIHAGWRGTAARITEQTLRHLSVHYGVNPETVRAFIGPSAGMCCYEVGEEVAVQFPDECRTRDEHGHYRLDVRKSNLLQLLENGVRNSNIEVNQDCSIHNRRYHSHRRDGAGSGRMFAVIGRKKR